MSDKVLYADVELTIHKTMGDEYELLSGAKAIPVESVTILPGQFIALADLPSYQREAALQRKIEGARVMTSEKAKILAEQFNPAPEVDLGEEETSTVVDEADEEVEQEAKLENAAVSKK